MTSSCLYDIGGAHERFGGIRYWYFGSVLAITAGFIVRMRMGYDIWNAAFTRTQQEPAIALLVSTPFIYVGAMLLSRLLAEFGLMLFRIMQAADARTTQSDVVTQHEPVANASPVMQAAQH